MEEIWEEDPVTTTVTTRGHHWFFSWAWGNVDFTHAQCGARACIETRRYCLRVSIPSQRKPVSMVSNIWYRYRPIPTTVHSWLSPSRYLNFWKALRSVELNERVKRWIWYFYRWLIFSGGRLPGRGDLIRYLTIWYCPAPPNQKIQKITAQCQNNKFFV